MWFLDCFIYICMLGFTYCFYSLFRNHRVYLFRSLIIDAIYNHNINSLNGKMTTFISYEVMPTYDNMLYSPKRLKINNWLQPDVVKLLKPFYKGV